MSPSGPAYRATHLYNNQLPTIEDNTQPGPGDKRTPGATQVIQPTEGGLAAMPLRAREIELFSGLKVTKFLDEYNRQTDNACLNTRAKVLVLPDYCDKIRRTFIKKLKSYVNVD
jgi:hypothetical protein